LKVLFRLHRFSRTITQLLLVTKSSSISIGLDKAVDVNSYLVFMVSIAAWQFIAFIAIHIQEE